MVFKVLALTSLLAIYSCSDDMFSTQKYDFHNFRIEFFVEGGASEKFSIERPDRSEILCLPGRILYGIEDDYIIVRNDMRGINKREYYCNSGGPNDGKLEFVLILPDHDSLKIIRSLDSVLLKKDYPFIDYDEFYSFKW